MALTQIAGKGAPIITQEMYERLLAENERLKSTGRALSMKVGAKGGACLYGMGRFPVTLFRDQWITLLDKADAIRKFLEENDHVLVGKGEAPRLSPEQVKALDTTKI